MVITLCRVLITPRRSSACGRIEPKLMHDLLGAVCPVNHNPLPTTNCLEELIFRHVLGFRV